MQIALLGAPDLPQPVSLMFTTREPIKPFCSQEPTVLLTRPTLVLSFFSIDNEVRLLQQALAAHFRYSVLLHWILHCIDSGWCST